MPKRRSDHSRVPGRPFRRGAWVGLIVLTVATALAGCRAEEPRTEPVGFDEPEYEGLSREEIERQAEPMTPAEAERLGIVDTTIRMESPINPDSLVELEARTVVPADTPVRQQ